MPGDESLFSWTSATGTELSDFNALEQQVEVKTWLWPLFTESHAILREEFLGLPPVPGHASGAHGDTLEPSRLRGGQLLLGT